jgi:hypothetical protein
MTGPEPILGLARPPCKRDPGSDVSLKGNLSTMALPDLLQWAATATKSGRMTLTDGRFKKEVLFTDGVIVASASNDPREYLGQFLLSHRRITEEQLRQAMETQRSTGVMLGKILVMLEAVSETDLLEMLTLKAQETIFSLFLWPDGCFEFDDRPADTKNLFPLSLRVEDILLEGLRRYDELQVIIKAFSPGDFLLQLTGKPIPPHMSESPEVRRLVEVLDRPRSLTDLCLEMHASEFKVSRLAYGLYRMGMLAVAPAGSDGKGGPAAETTSDLMARADLLLEAQKAGEAIDLLQRAAQSRPSDLAIKKKLEDAEAMFVERAYRHFLPPGQIPVLKKDMESLTGETLTPQEVFLVSRMNGSWTVKDVVTISPLREVEVLRALKALRERGIIELRTA